MSAGCSTKHFFFQALTAGKRHWHASRRKAAGGDLSIEALKGCPYNNFMRSQENNRAGLRRALLHFAWGSVLGVFVALMGTIGVSKAVRLSDLLVSAGVFGILAATFGRRFWSMARSWFRP